MSKRDRLMSWPSDVLWPDERVDRAFRDMFRDFFSGTALRDRFAEGLTSSLHLEEFLDGDTGVIRVEMPGIDPDKDVDISVTDGVLNVRAHREERKEEDRPDGYRSEFRYGRFQRSVQLPEGTTEADIKASYKDGNLEVRVPVSKATVEAAPTKIAIERA